MAEVLGARKRGRKREALRLAVEQLASKLSGPGKETAVEVEVNPPKTPKGKAETVTFEVPKGSAVVPPDLTRPKNDANAREQIRLGAEDAGIAVAIRSIQVRDDDGNEFPVFYMVKK